jgi:hypothetical protein
MRVYVIVQVINLSFIQGYCNIFLETSSASAVELTRMIKQ